MSYDLRVWCVERPAEANGTLARGRGWLITVGTSACELEDVPRQVVPLLPGVAYLVELSLQPIDAPKSARVAIEKLARAIAKSARGVIENPQTDTVETPAGIKRFAAPKRTSDERVTLLAMSWWFDHQQLAAEEGAARLLATLEEVLPEAIPTCYGEFEPPQLAYDHGARGALARFLAEYDRPLVVWYSRRPVTHVVYTVTRKVGWLRYGDGTRKFRCSHFGIEVDAAALELPGWERGLQHAWRRLSRELRPFYGDVRRLEGYVPGGRWLQTTSNTDVHPVRAWWWHGIPVKQGHAIVLGKPYTSRWRLPAGTYERDGELVFASLPSWREAGDITRTIGDVPADLASSGHDAYAKAFPFPKR